MHVSSRLAKRPKVFLGANPKPIGQTHPTIQEALCRLVVQTCFSPSPCPPARSSNPCLAVLKIGLFLAQHTWRAYAHLLLRSHATWRPFLFPPKSQTERPFEPHTHTPLHLGSQLSSLAFCRLITRLFPTCTVHLRSP